MREAAEEKLASARPRLFTIEELRDFAARCDARHPPGSREPDWSEVKRILVETRYPDLEVDWFSSTRTSSCTSWGRNILSGTRRAGSFMVRAGRAFGW